MCHFRQFNGPPFLLRSPSSRRSAVPTGGSALPTSAPGSLPPSSRRSEVNRRRGLKTTPTLSQRPSLPRLLNIVSLRTLPNRPSLPHLPAAPPHSLFLPCLGLTPVVYLTLPSLRPSVPTRRRNTNADEFLLLLLAPLPLTSHHPPLLPHPNAFSSPFFMRLLTISSNCAHPPPLARACLALPCPAEPFRKRERMRLNNRKRDDTCVSRYIAPRVCLRFSFVMLPWHETGSNRANRK